ncbi:MAG: nitroreductase family protein [Synergistaceae bacterium]|jgi:nitroreductase|nr:nitroreductase family protein [Synergistaceae bacterium]
MSRTISDIIERRSIRQYLEQVVPHDVLELLIKAAKYAPSAMNAQIWHFTVITNRGVIDRVTDTLKAASLHESVPADFRTRVTKPEYTVNYGAPAFIIISGDPVWATAINDCSLAAGNIMIAAHSLGLGSCWINQPGAVCDVPQFRSLLTELGVPQNYKVYACVCIGYPAHSIAIPPDRIDGVVNFVN